MLLLVGFQGYEIIAHDAGCNGHWRLQLVRKWQWAWRLQASTGGFGHAATPQRYPLPPLL